MDLLAQIVIYNQQDSYYRLLRFQECLIPHTAFSFPHTASRIP
jgi:hypothetical protein